MADPLRGFIETYNYKRLPGNSSSLNAEVKERKARV